MGRVNLMNFSNLVMAFALVGLSSCMSWFKSAEKPMTPVVVEENILKYSDQPQMGYSVDRQYKKMTKSRMEEESDLSSSAGSMWMMDGQTSYLFAQNKARKEGDILNVKMEGTALRQVETKVGVIKKLLKQLEDQEKEIAEQKRLAQEAEKAKQEGRAPASDKAAIQLPPGDKTPAPPQPVAAKKDEKDDLAEVQQVATRIAERLPDGNYRIKGTQPFMIGKREFKVILAGMIRPEDYNDEGVSSNKILDPQVDVVSLRRKDKNESAF
jgi:flagellar L-ring protein precursor FlgH